MLDVFAFVSISLLFAVAALYVQGCDRLKGTCS
jgi:hypothetical protein